MSLIELKPHVEELTRELAGVIEQRDKQADRALMAELRGSIGLAALKSIREFMSTAPHHPVAELAARAINEMEAK